MISQLIEMLDCKCVEVRTYLLKFLIDDRICYLPLIRLFKARALNQITVACLLVFTLCHDIVVEVID